MVTRLSTSRRTKRFNQRWDEQRPIVRGGDDHPTAPTLTSISPTTAAHPGANFTLTCTGTNFTGNSVIYFDGGSLATTFVGATSTTATIDGDGYADGAVVVYVRDGSSKTANQTFTFT